MPPIAGSFVGDYQFVGKLTWDECGLAYTGSYVQVPFTVEVQEGDFLLGILSSRQYDASGQVNDLTWGFHAHQCDLYNRCCIGETITTNTGGLPTDATFKFHYECSEDHTHCDAEAEGLTYVMPGTQGPYQ